MHIYDISIEIRIKKITLIIILIEVQYEISTSVFFARRFRLSIRAGAPRSAPISNIFWVSLCQNHPPTFLRFTLYQIITLAKRFLYEKSAKPALQAIAWNYTVFGRIRLTLRATVAKVKWLLMKVIRLVNDLLSKDGNVYFQCISKWIVFKKKNEYLQ